MTASRSTDRMSGGSFLPTWLLWTAGALAFPLAGLAGTGVAGRVDSPLAALVGGAVAGLVIGVAQALLSRGRLDIRRWAPATAIGMGLGLLLGAVTVGYETSLADLAVMGALTGVLLGAAQAAALPAHARRRWLWAAALPVLWALGWTATTLGGISVDVQFTVFGAYGAVTFCALSGLLLHVLLPYRAAATHGSAPTPVGDMTTAPRHVIVGTAASSTPTDELGVQPPPVDETPAATLRTYRHG